MTEHDRFLGIDPPGTSLGKSITETFSRLVITGEVHYGDSMVFDLIRQQPFYDAPVLDALKEAAEPHINETHVADRLSRAELVICGLAKTGFKETIERIKTTESAKAKDRKPRQGDTNDYYYHFPTSSGDTLDPAVRFGFVGGSKKGIAASLYRRGVDTRGL